MLLHVISILLFTIATFYKSSALRSPAAESFLPSSSTKSRQMLTPKHRKMLTPSPRMHQSPDQGESDVFQSPRRTKQLSCKRLPLTDLADHRNTPSSAPTQHLKQEPEGYMQFAMCILLLLSIT